MALVTRSQTTPGARKLLYTHEASVRRVLNGNQGAGLCPLLHLAMAVGKKSRGNQPIASPGRLPVARIEPIHRDGGMTTAASEGSASDVGAPACQAHPQLSPGQKQFLMLPERVGKTLRDGPRRR